MFKKFKPVTTGVVDKGQKKNKTILIVSLILFIVAGASIYKVFTSIYQPANVVVAIRDLDPLKKITNADVMVKQTSKRDRHPLAYTDTKQVIGTYPRMPITKDEDILKTKIVNNPDKLLETFETLNADEIIISLNSKNIKFPSILKKGDLVTVMVVTEGGVQEMAKGSKYLSNGVSDLVTDIKNVSAGNDPTVNEISLICKRDEGKKVLHASLVSKLIYIVPEHPDNL